MQQRTREALFVILVVLSVVAAWLAGTFRNNASVSEVLQAVMPEAHHFEKAPSDVYIGLVRQGNELHPVGYVGLCSATGHLGPIELAAGFDMGGWIKSVALVQPLQGDAVSPQTVNRVLAGFVGRRYTDGLEASTVAHADPGVQRLWQGLADLVIQVGVNVDRVQHQVVEEGYRRRRWFGLPEGTLLLLYGVGYLAYRERVPHARTFHVGVLAASLVLIGFWFRRPMSLEYINSFLMGYWPSWQTHLYWYLLIGGVLLPILVSGRSFYCGHVCPFGATQRILKTLGTRRVTVPERVDASLRWLQRILVWLAVLCALVARNPAVVRYDVPGVLFNLRGVTWQFVLLAIVLVASLVITRPWCNYLCPIRAITDFVALVRRVLGLAPRPAPSVGCSSGV